MLFWVREPRLHQLVLTHSVSVWEPRLHQLSTSTKLTTIYGANLGNKMMQDRSDPNLLGRHVNRAQIGPPDGSSDPLS